jgi:hypothetical protein
MIKSVLFVPWRRKPPGGPGKKTAAAVHQEVAREIQVWLTRIFAERHKTGTTDLEAVELGLRSTLHQAGAMALEALLRYPEPAQDQRTLPCPCGHQAHYAGLRSKTLLTVVGEVKLTRPYYLCEHCGAGQFPVDQQLDVRNTGQSPAVRRMLALVGAEAPFDQGRQQMSVLANLEVTTKAVERTAEAIGVDISVGEQQEVDRAMQLDLPIVVGEPIPILYVQMDGAGVPVVKSGDRGTQREKGRRASSHPRSQTRLRIYANGMG